MKTEKEKTSKIYWAGAYISFGLSFLGLELIALLNNITPDNANFQKNFRLLILTIYLLAGFIGGLLVAEKSSIYWLQGGLVSGIIAYIIDQIVHATLYGWAFVGNVLIMSTLIGGSLLGAAIQEYTDFTKFIRSYFIKLSKK